MRIYLDNCCYNRPFDDQTQERIHMESEAVLAIIGRCQKNKCKIIGSAALDFEIEQICDLVKRERVKVFYDRTIKERIDYNENILRFAHELSQYANIRMLDRFHLSFAVNSRTEILLTTDDKFEKAVSKLNIKTKVMNPLKYFMEVI
jgi:hypothetical protein